MDIRSGCPINLSVEVLGDRWSLVVLRDMMFGNFRTYGEIIYTLPAHYPSIQQSTLVLANIGRTLSELEGQLQFANDVILDVWELIDHAAGRILNYSYEIYQAGEKMSWYDPFAHPHIPELASTHPHHKHVRWRKRSRR